MTSEKRVSYTAGNTYTTLNEFSSTTKTVWLVFHGMGHLSRYFIRHFAGLNPKENFIIAPQAPSKYYQGPENKHVGASWLTREDTVEETKSVLAYVDAVWNAEKSMDVPRLVVFGYSQGVSIACRWLASRQVQCDHLLMQSGGIPKELTSESFKYMNKSTRIQFSYGTEDPYITQSRVLEEKARGIELFGEDLTVAAFKGAHEVYVPFIERLVVNF